MNEFEGYGFTEIPFPITPEHTTKHWAGRKKLRRTLIDVIESPRQRDIKLTEFVVLHGSYGAGKSHALRYLKNFIEDHPEDYRSQAVYIESIRIEDKITFLALFRQIITQLGDNYLKELAGQVIAHIHRLEENTENYLALQRENRLREFVLQQFDRELQPMLELLCKIAEEDISAVTTLIDHVNNDFKAAKQLGALFGCLQRCSKADGSSITEANYIFLDEVEAITEVKVGESQAFFNAILQLVNQMPSNFCLICSFSGDTALLEAVVNEALLQRLSRPYIEIPELEPEEAKDFLAKQFETFRPDRFQSNNRFHPFSPEAVDYVLGRTLPMTPRNIFLSLRRVLERCVKRRGLEPSEEIQKEDAEAILN